jgi:hypothetical protein
MPIIMSEFYTRAEAIGLDIQALKRGETTHNNFKVNSADELRQLFCDGLSAEKRQERRKLIEQQHALLLDENNVGHQALAKRIEVYVFADRPLSASDLSRTASYFPMDVEVTASENYTVPANTVWNLGNSTSPQSVVLGTLTLQAGASIQVSNTVLSLTVDTLSIQRGSSTAPNPWDIGILGVTGHVGDPGSVGKAGGDGGNGSGGNCSSAGISGGKGDPGVAGTPGGLGGIGIKGYSGLASLTANITVNASIDAAQLVVFTQSGPGGVGGVGGVGGAGGAGGKGGKGATCDCECTNGGPGGAGGAGGVGGLGGPGGDGTDGNDSYVNVPSGSYQKVVTQQGNADPGFGGTGGQGGTGGAGGGGGGGGGASGCSKCKSGSSGAAGAHGSPGDNGSQGLITGSPGNIYVTEQAS